MMTITSRKSATPNMARYSEAICIFLLVMVIILVQSNSLGGTGNQIPSQSTCYISVQLHCFQFQITNNEVSGTAILLFTNNLGTTIYFQRTNSIAPLPQVRRARAYPANAVPGATIVCNATLTGCTPEHRDTSGADISRSKLLPMRRMQRQREPTDCGKQYVAAPLRHLQHYVLLGLLGRVAGCCRGRDERAVSGGWCHQRRRSHHHRPVLGLVLA